MKSLILLPLIATTAACGSAVATEPMRDMRAETRLARLLDGKVAGRTMACINQRDAMDQRIIDERTIVYRVGRGRLYRNDIPGGCPRLDSRSTLIRRTTSPSICSGEIFEVRDAALGTSYGSCTFGEFTEYRRAGT